MVNLTGPCFMPGMRVTCRFNTKDSEGIVLNENRLPNLQTMINIVSTAIKLFGSLDESGLSMHNLS